MGQIILILNFLLCEEAAVDRAIPWGLRLPGGVLSVALISKQTNKIRGGISNELIIRCQCAIILSYPLAS